MAPPASSARKRAIAIAAKRSKPRRVDPSLQAAQRALAATPGADPTAARALLAAAGLVDGRTVAVAKPADPATEAAEIWAGEGEGGLPPPPPPPPPGREPSVDPRPGVPPNPPGTRVRGRQADVLANRPDVTPPQQTGDGPARGIVRAERERRILALARLGWSHRAIAIAEGCSRETIRRYLNAYLERFQRDSEQTASETRDRLTLGLETQEAQLALIASGMPIDEGGRTPTLSETIAAHRTLVAVRREIATLSGATAKSAEGPAEWLDSIARADREDANDRKMIDVSARGSQRIPPQERGPGPRRILPPERTSETGGGSRAREKKRSAPGGS